jgi:hypothetical protein
MTNVDILEQLWTESLWERSVTQANITTEQERKSFCSVILRRVRENIVDVEKL